MKGAAKNRTMFFSALTAVAIAAPFIGLVCVVFFPFIGLAMLAWIGGRALLKPVSTNS